MDNVFCIACGNGLAAARPRDGPMRLYSCVRCLGSRGEAVMCSQCGFRWNGRETDVCARCLENRLAEKGIYPEFKGRP